MTRIEYDNNGYILIFILGNLISVILSYIIYMNIVLKSAYEKKQILNNLRKAIAINKLQLNYDFCNSKDISKVIIFFKIYLNNSIISAFGLKLYSALLMDDFTFTSRSYIFIFVLMINIFISLLSISLLMMTSFTLKYLHKIIFIFLLYTILSLLNGYYFSYFYSLYDVIIILLCFILLYEISKETKEDLLQEVVTETQSPSRHFIEKASEVNTADKIETIMMNYRFIQVVKKIRQNRM